MSQNIFDDPVFFEGYYQLRQGLNYKDLFEQPAMRRLLPDVAGKRVLDIGCGYGHNCLDFAQKGAQRVLGIDLSEKMLAVARSESTHPHIEYRRMDMADLSQLNPGYDLIYSSLAFHYAADFGALAADIVRLLNPGGQLLYSQEHPLVTATIDCKGHYNRDEQGRAISYTFSDYARSGQRVGTWFVDGVVNYHRPMGEILTTLARAGLVIDEVVEPTPEDWAIHKNPALVQEFIKPTFLIVRAHKA